MSAAGGPFYAKPELLIGFAAAVACTIALRFMLQIMTALGKSGSCSIRCK
jgi:hypothetical protein